MPTLWYINCYPTILADVRVDSCLMFWITMANDVLAALHSYLKSMDILDGSCEAMQSTGV